MSRKLTLLEFIHKARQIHGNVYGYSLVEYRNNRAKVKLICNLHGEFNVSPSNHLNRKSGCPKCANALHSRISAKTLSEFIEQAKIIHGNVYNYSSVEYKNMHSNVTIVCKIHGQFKQTPKGHIVNKNGCPQCKSSKGERLIMNFLQKTGTQFVYQKKFSDCKSKNSLKFDFYLPQQNLLIEYDGEIHDIFTPYIHKTAERWKEHQARDDIKTNYAKENKIGLLRINWKDKYDIPTLLQNQLQKEK